MFTQKFYHPQALIQIEEAHKYQNHPELYLKRQIIVNERELIKQILYMISGLQTELFVKKFDQVQFDSEKGQVQRVYSFVLRQDVRTVFTHLTYEAIKSCTQIPLKIGNLVYYLTSKSKILYQKTLNVVLKAFAEGIINFINRITIYFTEILTELQKQSGNISNFMNLNQNPQKKLTLLKLTHIFQQKIPFISEVVNILSRILPYMHCSNDLSQAENYFVIQILFDQFSALMNSLKFKQQEQQQILKIYQNSLMYYTELIQNWLEMNPYLLQTRVNVPFFIKLSQINFSLSKAVVNQNTSILKNYYSVSLKAEQIYKSDQFVELFFKLDNLLVQEYLPQIFKKQAQCILELGKIIQFIYLYYSTEQRPTLRQYFGVQSQFKVMFDLIKSHHAVDLKHQQYINKESMFIADNKKILNRKQLSISQRLTKKSSNQIKFLNLQKNPLGMYSTVEGFFKEASRPQQKFIKSSVILPKQHFTNNKTESESVKPILLSFQNFKLKFERILSEVIQRLYEKTLFFFQQQSEKQFFKLSSHVQITSAIQLQASTVSFHHMSLPNQIISRLSNNQRIISSISLTLLGIRKFMLYEQGDFFLEFVPLINILFENSHTKISRSLIQGCIQEAIKGSSANDLPNTIKDKISFIFLKKSKDPEIKQLKVWSVFSMAYKPEFPVNCIFNTEIMHNFGQIFNFIFNIKKCDHQLKGIWQDFKQNAKIQTQYSLFQTKRHPFESKILAIRMNVHHFISAVYGFVMITINSDWQQYIQQINSSFSNKLEQNMSTFLHKSSPKLHNPISLIELTQKLQKKLKSQTIQNIVLSNTMILISQLLGKFKKLLKIQPDSKQWNQIIFKQQIQYIGTQFMGIMDIAKNIEILGQTISFNNQI